MTDTLTLASPDDVADLNTYAQRAERLGCSLLRMASVGHHLVVTVCVLERQGLLDTHPYVFGLRVFELSEPNVDMDALVETRAMLDRLARKTQLLDMPVAQPRVPWAGIAAPREGWMPAGTIASEDVVATAKSGIDEVAAANGLGTNIVTEVRRTVWSRPMSGASVPDLPAGLAFAAFGLGFVVEGHDEDVAVTTNGSWTRLTTTRGYVLSRS